MIIASVPPAPPTYRPTYEELASCEIIAQYRLAEEQLMAARDGSEFLRRKFALLDAGHQFEALGTLVDGWDSYGAPAPSGSSIRAAEKLTELCVEQGLIPDAIISSAEGGVAICFAKGLKYSDIECLNSGEILAVRFGRNDDPVAWRFDENLDETRRNIQKISVFLYS